MRYSFEIPGKPVTQGSMRLVRGRIVHSSSKRLSMWRALVIASARERRPAAWSSVGPMNVEAVFKLARPKNHSRANGVRRNDAPWHPVSKYSGDLDKYARALLDALTYAEVFDDDSQVVSLIVRKEYVDNNERTGVSCSVQRLAIKR